MLELKLNNEFKQVVSPSSDRQLFNFTATETDDVITFMKQSDDDIADYRFRQIMLERGTEFDVYVENSNTESMLGAAFRHIQNLQTYVYDEDGNMTRYVKETLKSTLTVYQDILNGTSNETLESDEGLYRVIQNSLTGDFHRLVQTDDTFALEVGNIADDKASGKLQVNNDNLALGLFGNTGMISGLGVVNEDAIIKGKHIFLDGEVFMNNAFISSLMTQYIIAEDLTAERGQFGTIIAKEINVNNLAGNRMSFIKGIFNGVDTDMYLDGDGIIIDSHSRWDLSIDYRGIVISSRYGRGPMALLQGYNTGGIEAGMALIAERNFEISLGRRVSGNVFNSVLTVPGTASDRINLYAPLYAGASSYGLDLVYGSIGGTDTGIRLLAKGSNDLQIGGSGQEVWLYDINRGFYSVNWIISKLFSLESQLNNL